MATKSKRVITDAHVMQYEPMLEMFVRNNCAKNWTDAKTGNIDAFLGASGYSLRDLKQHLWAEICIALQNYDPEFKTQEGKTVKESTFVYQHLTFRVGQMMKRLTKRRMGYGVRHSPFDLIIQSGIREQSIVDSDFESAFDARSELEARGKRQVDLFLERKRRSW